MYFWILSNCMNSESARSKGLVTHQKSLLARTNLKVLRNQTSLSSWMMLYNFFGLKVRSKITVHIHTNSREKEDLGVPEEWKNAALSDPKTKSTVHEIYTHPVMFT